MNTKIPNQKHESENESNDKKTDSSFIYKLVYSACGVLVATGIGFYAYSNMFVDERAYKQIKAQHFDNDEMREAKSLDGLEVIAAISPKEKLAMLDGLTQAKASELVLKIGQSDINAVAIFKTPHPFLHLAYGTNCAGHYKYTFVTPARVASPELLMKPAVLANVNPEDRTKNPYIEKMPIIYTDQLYESRVSYIFHEKDNMNPIQEGSEEEMLDISLCLEGGKDELYFNPINEENVAQKEAMFRAEIESQNTIE
ncbi:hypothetical protein MUB04_14760 [Acinetobacter indicus]|uniref:hypothetical protein n=1 Tax=Acinetobacter TaxID=469 RepID=UPI0015D44C36|nr:MULTISPECIES: hypothetical protein [Acinetobacter]MCP0917794.1 hypothetical protein [Acinetobacter indicus]